MFKIPIAFSCLFFYMFESSNDIFNSWAIHVNHQYKRNDSMHSLLTHSCAIFCQEFLYVFEINILKLCNRTFLVLLYSSFKYFYRKPKRRKYEQKKQQDWWAIFPQVDVQILLCSNVIVFEYSYVCKGSAQRQTQTWKQILKMLFSVHCCDIQHIFFCAFKVR